MGRIRLAALFFCFVCLLLCASQEAAAQSPRVMVTPSTDNGVPASNIIFRAPLTQPKPSAPEVFYCETADTTCRTTQDVFPLAELRDLFVFVAWPGVAGQHVQTMEFLLPDGSMYNSKKTQFIVGGVMSFSLTTPLFQNVVAPMPPARHLMADANKIHTEGIPSLLMRSRGETSILTVLPVAGTYITQRNLAGTWRVRVLLDDRLVTESTFTLTPRPAPVKPQDEAGSGR